MCISLPMHLHIFRVAPRYAREMQSRGNSETSQRRLDLQSRDRARRRVSFFFEVNRDRHTRSEFRAAIFIGAASENQLNGNNESPMHVERSAYVLQSCNAIVCPWRSGTYFQICTYTRNWWASRANFYRWYWNRIVLNSSTKSVNKLCRYRARVISMKSHKYRETGKRTVPVLKRFEYILRENRNRILTIWSNHVIIN